jgi:hypothetical protein
LYIFPDWIRGFFIKGNRNEPERRNAMEKVKVAVVGLWSRVYPYLSKAS